MLKDLQSTQCVVFCLPRILDVMHPGCPTNPPNEHVGSIYLHDGCTWVSKINEATQNIPDQRLISILCPFYSFLFPCGDMCVCLKIGTPNPP